MKRRRKRHDYALYYDDEFIDLGTIEFLSKKYNIKEELLHWYATPTARKRNKHYIVIRIEDDKDE